MMQVDVWNVVRTMTGWCTKMASWKISCSRWWHSCIGFRTRRHCISSTVVSRYQRTPYHSHSHALSLPLHFHPALHFRSRDSYSFCPLMDSDSFIEYSRDSCCSSVDVHVVCLVCNNTNTVTQLAKWPFMAGF